jgi:hypothetical protein
MLDDGIDNIALVINLVGRASVTLGHEATLNGFDAIGVLHAEPVAMCRSSGKWMALMIPRQALSPAIADIKRATMQLIPSGNAAIGLLVSYMDSLKDRLPSMSPELGKLAVFSGVSEFPVRVKCAALAWHTLKAALEGDETPVSTEVSESSSGDGGGHAL